MAIGTRHVSDDGRVDYEISEHDLKLAMHADDVGWIFDVSFNAWTRKITVTMSPEGNVS